MKIFKTKKIKKILKKYKAFLNSKAYKDVMGIKNDWEKIFYTEAENCPYRNSIQCSHKKRINDVCNILECKLIKK